MAKERIQRDLIDHEDLSAQMRTDIDEDLVAEYTRDMRNGQKFDVIEIMPKGDGTYWVIDGHHRIRATYKHKPKVKIIEAVVLQVPEGMDPKKAAKLAAFKVNLKHGKRLSNADKRNKCREAWTLEPDSWQQTDRYLAAIAEVDHKTAGSVRRELVKERLIPIRDGDHMGELKPVWFPIRYISQQNINEDFYDDDGSLTREPTKVFRFAEMLTSICDGDADAWSWNGERAAITHRGIEPGKTYSLSLDKNHAYQKGSNPIAVLVHELNDNFDEDVRRKKEAFELIRATGDQSYINVAREIIDGDMGETTKEALRELLMDPIEYDEFNSDF